MAVQLAILVAAVLALALAGFLVIVTYVPFVSTWLPTTMMGPERVG